VICCPRYPLPEVTPEEFDRILSEMDENLVRIYAYPAMFCRRRGYNSIWPKPPRGVGVVFEDAPVKLAYFYVCLRSADCRAKPVESGEK
jgi:hypothetical protein